MPNLKLPYQLGKLYPITPNVVARTRTIFSRRMEEMSQRILADALQIAQDSLVYTIQQIALNTLGVSAENPPQFDEDTEDENFTNAFISVFNVEAQTVRHYNASLLTFNTTCKRIFHGLSLPLQLIDIPISNQGSLVEGYVRNFNSPPFRGNIHIDFGIIHPGSEWRLAHLLVHEASHKFADTFDYANFDDLERYLPLEHELLLHNADSIARMVIGTYQARLQ